MRSISASPPPSLVVEGMTDGAVRNRELRVGRDVAAVAGVGFRLGRRGHAVRAEVALRLVDLQDGWPDGRGPRAARARAEAREDEAEQREDDQQERHDRMLRAAQHPLEERQRAGLVEGLVQVAALRALDARRAAALARTAAQELRGVLCPALEDVEAALGDPDAAGVAVVDEDRRPPRLEVKVGREPAD